MRDRTGLRENKERRRRNLKGIDAIGGFGLPPGREENEGREGSKR